MNLSKSKDFISKCLAVFGSTGYPVAFKPEYRDTWIKYEEGVVDSDLGASEDRKRFVKVVNFIRLLTKAGTKPASSTSKDLANINKWDALYKELVTLELVDLSTALIALIRKQNLLRWLRVERSVVNLTKKETSWLVQCDICFMLAKPKLQKLDAVLAELQGFLYKGNLPGQLQEKWKTGVKGHKPKSNLQPVSVLVKTVSNIGRYPLVVNPAYSVFIVRAASDRLILRLEFSQPLDSILDISKHKHSEMIKALFKKALLKVGA